LFIAETLVHNGGLEIYAVIIGMAVATYLTRLAGYWLLQGRLIEGRLLAALQAVPPAILTAVIAPAVFLQGPASMVAGAATLAAALMRLPLLVTIGVGVLTVALARQFM
jgi:uncharacterized membrane protein